VYGHAPIVSLVSNGAGETRETTMAIGNCEEILSQLEELQKDNERTYAKLVPHGGILAWAGQEAIRETENAIAAVKKYQSGQRGHTGYSAESAVEGALMVMRAGVEMLRGAERVADKWARYGELEPREIGPGDLMQGWIADWSLEQVWEDFRVGDGRFGHKRIYEEGKVIGYEKTPAPSWWAVHARKFSAAS
jgi:hypothetical protein